MGERGLRVGSESGTTGTHVRASEPLAPRGGRPHGRLRSWCLVAVVVAAFVAGGVALIAQVWWLVWVAVAVVVVSPLAGRVVGIMNDTVEWDVPLHRDFQPQGSITFGPPRRGVRG